VVPRVPNLVFIFRFLRPIFSNTEGAGSSVHFLLSQTHFRRYTGRPVKSSCVPLPNLFSAVPRALGPVFMFVLPDSFLAV
jgi:hypothetical protein